jgi:hypothetical protein
MLGKEWWGRRPGFGRSSTNGSPPECVHGGHNCWLKQPREGGEQGKGATFLLPPESGMQQCAAYSLLQCCIQ